MIWKILFVLLTVLFAFLQTGGLTSTLTLSEYNLAVGYIATILVLLILGCFFSLGWKKKLYSLKGNNIIFGFIISFVIFSIYESVKNGLPALVFEIKNNAGSGVSENSIYISSLLTLALISFVVYLIIYLPAIIAYFKYKKYYTQMSDVQKPYWKIFLTFFAAVSVLNSGYFLIFFDKTNYNVWDYLTMFSCVLDVFFAIGYAYNIKFGKQIIWKVFAIPYAVLSVASIFLCSEEFLTASKMSLYRESYVAVVFTTILIVAVYYAVYKYAFTGNVYKNEQIETSQN